MTSGTTRRAFLQTSMAAGISGIIAATPTNDFGGSGDKRWVKSPVNPILSLGRAGEFDAQNVFAPAIVKEDGRYFLFYSGGPSGPANGGEFVRYQLGVATSADGEHFTKSGAPLLPLGERDNFHCTPALLRNPDASLYKIGGRWQMVYCGNRADDVELATSNDGLHWQKDERSPIYRKAYAPNIVQLADEVRMYCVHKPEPDATGKAAPWEIHLATGRDPFSLKPHAKNPVLTVSQQWEEGALFYPYVLRENETWVMFYAAYWANQADKIQRTAIGIATSADGITWTKHAGNPVVTPTLSSSYDSHYTSSQSVIPDGDGYTMFYASRIDRKHKYFAICKARKQGRLLP